MARAELIALHTLVKAHIGNSMALEEVEEDT